MDQTPKIIQINIQINIQIVKLINYEFVHEELNYVDTMEYCATKIMYQGRGDCVCVKGCELYYEGYFC